MTHFGFVLPIDETFEVTKADGGHRPPGRYLKGYASTAALDGDGEKIVQKGLELDYFLRRGWINFDHHRDTIIGVPTTATVDAKGMLVEARLLDGMQKAEDVWTLSNALQKSGTDRRLGLSIEGKALERRGNTIVRARVYNVAVTPHPMNPEATFDVLLRSMLPCDCDGEGCCKPVLAKSMAQEGALWRLRDPGDADEIVRALDAGYGASPETQVDGGALRRESLDGATKTTTYGDVPKSCAHLKGVARDICVRALAKKSLDPDDLATIVQLAENVPREVAEVAVRRGLAGARS